MNKDAALKEAEVVTEHGDGDDGDGELDIELVEDDAPQPLCTWSSDPDEHRRAYVMRLYADSQIDGYILTSNMDIACQWLKTGKVPHRPIKKL